METFVSHSPNTGAISEFDAKEQIHRGAAPRRAGGISDTELEPMLAAARSRRSAYLGTIFLIAPPLALILLLCLAMMA